MHRSSWANVRIAPDGIPFTLAIVFGFVRNEGNAWSWISDHLTRTIDAHTPAVPSEAPESDLLSDCEAVVAAIGRRLGEMHAILAQESYDPAFAPKVADGDGVKNWARKTEERIHLAFEGIARLQTWERETRSRPRQAASRSAQQHSRCRPHAREFRRGHDHDSCAWGFSSWPSSGCRRRLSSSISKVSRPHRLRNGAPRPVHSVTSLVFFDRSTMSAQR